MTNPVSQIPSAQLPPIGEVLVDSNGQPTPLFHRFLVGLWARTGGAQGSSTTDVAAVAANALSTAEGALAAAQVAQSAANSADLAAQAAQTNSEGAATTAAIAYNEAVTITNAAMVKSGNLSDVSSISTARSNLGLATVPLYFYFDTFTASLVRGMPVLQNLTIAANFAGSVAWYNVATTNDTVLNIGVHRGGVTLPIGTLTFVHAGLGTSWSHQPSFPLLVGDVLVVSCPVSPDPTLAQVAFTLKATLT
jgi:hypothetical protein